MLNDTSKTSSFCDYYEQWVEVYKKGAIREATMSKYLMTQKWLKKLAPDLLISELTRTAYQQLLNDYAKDHERQTTLDFHHQLKGAILDAVDEGLIERDPTRKAIIKGKTPRAKKIKYLNQFELHTLIANLDIKEMDISRKIHASVEMKQNRGETTGGNTVPYGYFVKSGEKYFSIDESSIIVEQIFAMALQGLSSGAIAKKLTADGVLRPSQYRKTGSLSIFDGFSESNAWYASTIDRILANGAYTGDTYCRKSQKKLYERTERVYFGKEDWKCVENTHPAIISKEDFEKVQELRAKARKRYREKCKVKAVGTVHLESNIFEGKIFCGDCGSPMYWMEDPRYRNHERFWGKTYKCGSFVTNHTMCSSKRIIEEDVCDVVQKAIVSRVVLVDACLKFIKTETANSFSEILKQYESRKLKQTGKLNFLESQKASIYMEYADGGCSVSDYEKKKAGLLLEIETQKRKIMETSNRIKKINKAIKQENRLHKAWISGKKSSVIDRSMVDAFVEQIRVYDDKRIEIDFTFEDEIQSLVAAREEMDLWQAA